VPIFEEVFYGIEKAVAEELLPSGFEIGQTSSRGRACFRLLRLHFRDDLCHDTVALAKFYGLAGVDPSFELVWIVDLVECQ